MQSNSTARRLVCQGASQALSLSHPPLTLNSSIYFRTVWATGRLLTAFPRLPPTLSHALPSLAGLATIPLVVPHIDEAVTTWMEHHVRPHLTRAVARHEAVQCGKRAVGRPAHQ